MSVFASNKIRKGSEWGMNRAVFTVDECLLEMVNVEKTLSGLFCLLLHVSNYS